METASYMRKEKNMKYNVHIYTLVRVKVANVEADSQQDAIVQAEKFLDKDIFKKEFPVETGVPYVEHIESAEKMADDYLVDEVGDESFAKTKCWKFNEDRNSLVQVE